MLIEIFLPVGLAIIMFSLGLGLSLDDFRGADEVFMSGNISKVTPVTRFDDVEYGAGKVAPRAREIYWQWAEKGQRL